MNYIAALQEHHLKATPQRVEIVNLLTKYGHINIDDLYKFLQKKFPSLSLATIYKNINLMCEKKFLNELKIPEKKNVYELTKEEHSHVVCSQCGTIMDIQLDTANLLAEAKSLSHYNLERSSIVLNGYCPECQAS